MPSLGMGTKSFEAPKASKCGADLAFAEKEWGSDDDEKSGGACAKA